MPQSNATWSNLAHRGISCTYLSGDNADQDGVFTGRYTLLRSAHTMGLVPATSPFNKSQGLVTSCELAIFAAKPNPGPCD